MIELFQEQSICYHRLCPKATRAPAALSIMMEEDDDDIYAPAEAVAPPHEGALEPVESEAMDEDEEEEDSVRHLPLSRGISPMLIL